MTRTETKYSYNHANESIATVQGMGYLVWHDYERRQTVAENIDSTVYYDDEYRSPLDVDGEDAKKAAWVAYNIWHHQFRADFEKHRKHEGRWCFDSTYHIRPFVCENYDGCCYVVWGADIHDACRWPEDTRRYLTDQELDELMDCYDQIEADYRKRLDAYWNRYRSNIYSVGYWANR